MWAYTSKANTDSAGSPYRIEVGIAKTVQRSGATRLGFYRARYAPGSGFDIWDVSGNVGPWDTWHKYNVTRESDRHDVKIDNVVKGHGYVNGRGIWRLETRAEAHHCAGVGNLNGARDFLQTDWVCGSRTGPRATFRWRTATRRTCRATPTLS
jgi:hypothetical protein